MIMIATHQTGNQLTLEVQGRLAGTGVATLEDCWRTAAGRTPVCKFTIDLTGVTFIDQAGELLLQLMDREGVGFTTAGLMTEEVNEILGRNRK